jgi:hypothetical protein
MRAHVIFAVCLAILLSAAEAVAQQPGAQEQPQQQQAKPAAGAQAKEEKPAPPVEKSSVTHHSAKIGGQTINYTATIGTYVIKDDAGEAKASFFYVGYAKDGVADPATRPVAFSYNGGPGSASLFVHMGFGPKRPVVASDGHGMPAPYLTTDNEDSFLDATDLVFVDAISTGASRPAAGQDPKQFHGLVEDANYFADFIYQYITRNNRWASPKFLIGESYGTTRSAELAGVLQHRHEIYLSGIVMVSTYLIPPTIDESPSNDMPTMFYLPTYTTTAWYHHLLAPDLQNLTLEQVAQQAREFADGEYAQALLKGDQLPDAERQKVVQDLARFTALSPKIYRAEQPAHSGRPLGQGTRARQAPHHRATRFAVRGHRRGCGGRRHPVRSERGLVRGHVDGDVSGLHPSRIEVGQRLLLHGQRARVAVGRTGHPEYPGDAARGDDPAKLFEGAIRDGVLRRELSVSRSGIHDEPHGARTVDAKNVSFTYVGAGHMPYVDREAHDKLHKDVDAFINSSYGH